MTTGSPLLGAKQRLLRVVSRCETVDDFVGVFRRFSDGESIFIVTKTPKTVGTIQPVAITLKGGRAVLSGTGEVVEVHDAASGVAGRPGMRIRFTSMDDDSRRVLERMGRSAEVVEPTLPPPRPSSPANALAGGVGPSRPLPGMTPAVDDDEDTSVSGGAAVVQRTAGSSLVMPANPFYELPDESLMGFIECTLYEDSGLIRVPDEDPGTAAGSDRMESVDGQPSGLPSWWPKSDTGRVPQLPADGTPPHAVAPPRAASPQPFVPGQAFTNTPVPPQAYAPTAAQAFAPAAPAMTPAQAAGQHLLAPHDPDNDTGLIVMRPSRWKTPAVAASGAALGALLMGYVIWGGSDESSAPPAAAAAARAEQPAGSGDSVAPESGGEQPAVEPEPAPEPDAGVEAEPEPSAEVEVPPEPVPAPAGGAGAAAADLSGTGCTLVVEGYPPKAPVLIGGEPVGALPYRRDMGCGSVTVTVDHPRYQPVIETVELAPGADNTLKVQLARPKHRLTITSTPSGATVSVGGRRIGKTPTTATVMGFEKANIAVSLSGYKPWTLKVYSRQAKQTVSAKLRPLKQSGPVRRTKTRKK